MTKFCYLFLIFAFFSCSSEMQEKAIKEQATADSSVIDKEMIEVSIENDTAKKERRYILKGSDCPYILVTYPTTSLNTGLITNRSKCAVIKNYEPLLLKIFENDDSIRTLFWGSLNMGNHEMSKKLALAVKESKVWDLKTGNSKKIDVNNFIKELSNEKMIYAELNQLFTKLGYSIHISGIEKVLIKNACELPNFDELKAAGIDSLDKVPADCMTWFAVQEIQSIE